MLHLVLVGGDLACASHGTSGGHAMAEMAAPGVASHHHDAGTAAAVQHDRDGAHAAPDCATPSQQRCCDAMSSCSVTTTVSPVQLAAMSTPSADATPLRAPTVLVSVLHAPEPPPPKA